jgi:hypothetical protein
MSIWQPIETAPKDGTKIVIWNEKYDHCPIAKWDAHDRAQDGFFFSWRLEGGHSPRGCCDSNFIGWEEDLRNGYMPTHWITLPGMGP